MAVEKQIRHQNGPLYGLKGLFADPPTMQLPPGIASAWAMYEGGAAAGLA